MEIWVLFLMLVLGLALIVFAVKVNKRWSQLFRSPQPSASRPNSSRSEAPFGYGADNYWENHR